MVEAGKLANEGTCLHLTGTVSDAHTQLPTAIWADDWCTAALGAAVPGPVRSIHMPAADATVDAEVAASLERIGRGSALATDAHSCLGGTFDHLHGGHKMLLSVAAYLAVDLQHCGVSGDELLTKKTHAEFLEPLELRMSKVSEFLSFVRPGLEQHVRCARGQPSCVCFSLIYTRVVVGVCIA